MPTLKELQKLEREGINCKNCVYYPCSIDRALLPICYSFKKSGDPKINKGG